MKFFSSIVILSLFISSCTDLPDITSEESVQADDISYEVFMLPDTIWTGQSGQVQAAVKVTPSELAEKTLSLKCAIDGQTSQQELVDNGTGADLVYNDGIFSAFIDLSFFQGHEGSKSLLFSPVFSEEITGSASDFDTPVFITGEARNLSPSILSVSRPDSILIETDQVNILTASVSDPDGYTDITVVSAKIYPPQSPASSRTLYLRDDGSGADQNAKDGVFSLNLDHKKVGPEGTGRFYILLEATDQYGNVSKGYTTSIVYHTNLPNQPPEISNLSVPDTVHVKTAVVITLNVYDPDGMNDIAKVYFNSTLPSGLPSSGNPFSLLDDGSENTISGDAVKGDGIFTITVQVPETAQKGTYHFVFQAEDTSGALSNQIDHPVIIQF